MYWKLTTYPLQAKHRTLLQYFNLTKRRIVIIKPIHCTYSHVVFIIVKNVQYCMTLRNTIMRYVAFYQKCRCLQKLVTYTFYFCKLKKKSYILQGKNRSDFNLLVEVIGIQTNRPLNHQMGLGGKYVNHNNNIESKTLDQIPNIYVYILLTRPQ